MRRWSFRREILLVALILGGGIAAIPPASSQQASSVELAPGPGRDVVQKNCTACHGIDRVTAHRDTPARWAQIVDSMAAHGMNATNAEMDVITSYLAAHYGQGGPDLPAAAGAPSPSSPVADRAAPAPASFAPWPKPFPRLPGADWTSIDRDAGAQRSSPLTEITPKNVNQLKLAWQFSMSPPATVLAAEDGSRRPRTSLTEVTPLVVAGVMYLITPYQQAVALDAATGRQLWSTAIPEALGRPALRGASYWPGDGTVPPRILFGASQGYLVALDARTGAFATEFGSKGVLNLKTGIADKFPDAPFGLDTPPAIYKNIVITGSRVQEAPVIGPAGDVRGWDARTGKLIWTFHTIPRPGEPGYESWAPGAGVDRSGANVWGTLTVDVKSGIVFLPIGSANYDFWGADRPGANLYTSTLVALDAQTGRLIWHYQTTHHDLWDYDLNAAPVVADITIGGKPTPVVIQATKQTMLFILDRRTGKPVFPVEERPVPQDGFNPGEKPWPTQPYPTTLPPLGRTGFDHSQIAKVTPEHQAFCEGLFQGSGARTGSTYIPYGAQAAIVFPSTIGGIDWQGLSYDPVSGYAFAAVMNLGEFYQWLPDPTGAKPPSRVHSAKFWDVDKMWPCSAPPWGELVAVDIANSKIAWKVPLGEFQELTANGVPKTGTPLMGGATATASGVVFVTGTVDGKFRAFDSKTGDELWSTALGAAAHGLAMTYLGADERQYVAVTVSGGSFLNDPAILPVLNVYALH